MTREEALTMIRRSWKSLYPLDGQQKGIICPLCGSGGGAHGTGVREIPGKPGSLKCFACGFSGDVLDLRQQETGGTFNESFEWAAGELGLTIDKNGPRIENRRKAEEIPAKKETAPQNENTADYTQYYDECRRRIKDPKAAAYIQGRGISLTTAAAFRIGYDSDADPANAPGASVDEYRPHPCPRIIIPTSKSHYMGRSIKPDTDPAFVKLNAKGSRPGIFNFDSLYQGAAPVVFVTEGVFDALSLLEIGQEAISLNSTENRRKLLDALKERPTEKTLILCLDNDTAGERAAMDLLDGLQAIGVKCVKADICGAAKDPNEALVKDREEFRARVDAAKALKAPEPQEAEEIPDKEENPATGQKKTIAEAFLEKIQDVTYMPYETGLKFFDNLLGGGVIRQTLLLLLAAPGAGKTTLCQQIAEEMAAKGKPVVYLNLEMSAEQMLAKALSSRMYRRSINRVEMTATAILQGYRWTEEQRNAIINELKTYETEIMPYLQYNPAGVGNGLERIREYLKQIGQAAKKDGREAPVVVLDYLHLVAGEGRADPQETVKAAVVMLKRYAMKYNTFAVGIVAANRASNKTGKIDLNSGRDSSSLEYTADYQLSLNYAPIDSGYVSPDDMEALKTLQAEFSRRMIIRVLKNRFGEIGRACNTYFVSTYNSFFAEGDWMPADPNRNPFDKEKKEAEEAERKRLKENREKNKANKSEPSQLKLKL